MGKPNTGIEDANGRRNPPKKTPEVISTKKRRFNDGQLATYFAVAGLLAATINFGGERILRSSADNIYAGGTFVGGIYRVDKPGVHAELYCSKAGGDVIKSERTLDELGEHAATYDNLGHPGACPDGVLTKPDGEIWQSRTDQLGLLGVIFE